MTGPTHPTLTVSVVTISFRDLAGLRKTVDSVRSQRGSSNVEHIVIDGNSGPDVVEYLTSLDPQPFRWVSEPDNGRYDAMNKGLSMATGDVLWLMHSGDIFSDPGAIEAAVTSLSAPRAQWGYGKVRRIGEAGEDLGEWGFSPFDLTAFASGRGAIPHQASYFGADISRELGSYDETFGLAADQLYIFNAALHSAPVVLDRVVCDFDTSGAGTVRPIKENFADLRRAWDSVGYYPSGNRRRDRAKSRVLEYLTRTIVAVKPVVSRLRSR
ncbi:putative glycosyltransferase [Rhodococcoides trifolii]|uniref:4,4'-diaponeurosporenoate glycosyltransferase n=1 Tax=Rhodococcoides trifolii TaxID=908250 RepID=A0A917G899_9NOCA|nr:glycosyltransferase family 2 protein [Rhodococcus trifolii]GGG27950.1 putative glycosyltransferase [Rhodococcus trifolii]